MEGPEPGFETDERSLGEFILHRLQSHPQTDIIQINAETGEQQTIAELVLTSIQLGAGLEARGVAQGDVVMLMGNYSANLFAVILGAIYQNAILFPVDPNLKEAEAVSFLLGLCQPKIIFCDLDAYPRIKKALNKAQIESEVVVLDTPPSTEPSKSFADLLNKQSAENYKLQPVNDPKTEVILMSASSGTTGKPKAILLTHRSFVYTCQIWESVAPAKRKLRNLQASLLSWVTGFTIFIASCAVGYPRVYTRSLAPKALIEAIHNFKPNWVFIAPTILYDISTLPNFEDYDLSSMKFISVGGSPLDAKTRSLVQEKWPKEVRLNQSYGCTEIGAFITEPFSDAPHESAGRLIRGIQAKVTDSTTGKRLTFNEVGKLSFLNPKTFMKGYLNNPEAKPVDSEGFYYTGDVGYITEDGLVFITGRISDMLLVMNQLVSPMELENAIRTIDGVLDVAVVGKKHEIDNDHPTAAVVKKPGATITEQEIIAYVEENFSWYKRLYGGVYFVDRIPRNTNGKIIRSQVSKMLGL